MSWEASPLPWPTELSVGPESCIPPESTESPPHSGTSGLLSRSNKIMYDRATNSLWQQFTGEPVVGPLADSGIKLSFFPVLLTTWKEWAAEHPDTTVLSIYTGVYPRSSYRPESNPQAIYYVYFNSPDTMFPVPNRSPVLETKDVVLGLSLGDTHKAYPVRSAPGASGLSMTSLAVPKLWSYRRPPPRRRGSTSAKDYILLLAPRAQPQVACLPRWLTPTGTHGK